MNDKERERMRNYMKNRYHNDAAFREKAKERARAWNNSEAGKASEKLRRERRRQQGEEMVCYLKRVKEVSEATKETEPDVKIFLKEIEKDKGHDYVRDAPLSELIELILKKKKLLITATA